MINQPSKGKFIVLYGVNNLGKTTQAKLLVENLIIQLSKKAEYIKYPVYKLQPSGPEIYNYLKQGNPHDLTPREFQFVQILNRTQYEPTLKEKLDQGIWVVAEDYTGTGIAWGMATGVNKNLLYTMNSHLLNEDLGILFKGEPFPENLDKNNLHETDPALLKKTKMIFENIAKDFGWETINANQSKEDVQKEILQIVKNKISYLE
ncbi:MAG: hypothetical protein GF365_03050 [Candidatus Buchananbacteria bacterium]|nr:hypothetical protein [Candidatus Buchananbacteria bacterium]